MHEKVGLSLIVFMDILENNSNLKKLVLGLDIGIASVGWGIIDLNTGKPIDAGVRLFPEGTAAANADRRKARSMRRLLRRRGHRIARIKSLLRKEGLIGDSFAPLDNPYSIRVKGLDYKLSGTELATALLHIAKHRGLDNVDVLEESKEEQEESQKTKDILKINAEALHGKFVCQVQKERFDKTGSVRGIQNRFRTEDYIKELQKIFSHQDVSEPFKEEAIRIIQSRRKYYDGPGSEKSPTPYGKYFYDEAGVLQRVGMIEKMRGKCTYFSKESRAPKLSYTACLFNLLNDLNNLSVNGEKLSFDQKRDIVEKYIRKKGKITPGELSKFLRVDLDTINGFRIDKKNTPLLTNFDGFNKIRRVVEKNNLNPKILENLEYIDAIMDALTAHKGVEERINEMHNNPVLPNDIFDTRTLMVLANISSVTGYHALSYKAMHLAMEDLWHTSDNQMQVFSRLGLFSNRTSSLKGLRHIPFNDAEILSPVAKRAQREAVKIVNAIRDRYGELDSIVVETARDKNSKEEKDRITNDQKKFELLKKQAIEEAGRKLTPREILKVRLYKEQDGKCLYTGRAIDLGLLLSDSYAYDVDHIIPLTISFDDSYNNKTLCYADANREKGNRTPFHYFKSGAARGRTYDKFKSEISILKGIHPKKRQYLLFERDINKWEVQQEFISRNLVDTRYASKAILNLLSGYFSANAIPTSVHTIRGAVTSAFRKRSQINKDRDQDYSHHAVDALIVAGVKKMSLFEHVLDVFIGKDGEVVADRKTGEVITPDNEEAFFERSFVDFVRYLRESVQPRYSHKVDRKPNRGMSDQTIYGVREYEEKGYLIEKCKDIYDEQDGLKIVKLFRNGKAKEKILMARHDPKTFTLLEKIVDSYPEARNPFAAFRNQNNAAIRKVSKKRDSGPEIKSLRYLGGKLGIHMDISKKYQEGMGGRVVKLSLNPFRIDVYRDSKNTYKFLRITHADIRRNKNSAYAIDQETYETEKFKRGIGEKFQFCFSLHKNDIFGFLEKGSPDETIVRFNGVDYGSGRIEYKFLDKSVEGRQRKAIGSMRTMQKYNVDALGYLYSSDRNETCKLKIDMIH